MKPIEEKLMLLHRELRLDLNLHQVGFDEIFSKFDEVYEAATSREFHSCPICGEELERIDLDLWECSGLYHGEPIVFKIGMRNCSNCRGGGPYCNYSGYCLAKKFIAYGKPSICTVGRIDDQSPK